ncbi:hypothetical protein U8V72_21275 [Priestia filamentosa]|uniref:hypothetical protein n=1 Tax=Priestia filamentosa TaxID=1402861 RepID=UPI00397C3306
MKRYWMFKVLILLGFLVSLTIFYLFQFNTKGFVYFATVGIVCAVLNLINDKVNGKKHKPSD